MMGRFGRLLISFIFVFTVALWHFSYFLINYPDSWRFFITEGFLKYDYIYVPIILPFFWWLGSKFDQVRFLSERDELTSLCNRRFIIERFPSLQAKADKANAHLDVSVLDINNFKRINDTYGHEIGDAVLEAVAHQLTSNTPDKSYLIARWGGDEFLVVALTTKPGESKAFLEKVRRTLADTSTKLGLQVMLSLGTACYPEEGRELDALIMAADREMYSNKG